MTNCCKRPIEVQSWSDVMHTWPFCDFTIPYNPPPPPSPLSCPPFPIPLPPSSPSFLPLPLSPSPSSPLRHLVLNGYILLPWSWGGGGKPPPLSRIQLTFMEVLTQSRCTYFPRTLFWSPGYALIKSIEWFPFYFLIQIVEQIDQADIQLVVELFFSDAESGWVAVMLFKSWAKKSTE